ncbi:MAG: ABC transporter ATP-binding protein [Thermoproteota archaeon]|jgi:ABC-2 type transport system ATP-binding protein|nr:ABC transporter ATP-binding protein [Thermoproteota archaeon]
MKVIEVESLTKKYGKIIAIDNVSFHVNKGEIFGYLGPNGSGKTTTVEILECLRKPDSGRARVLGYDLKEANEIKKRIGVMPQNFAAFDLLTVEENVALVARIYKRKKEDVKRVLDLLDLWEIRKRKYEDLSGGTQRRVGIAMALVNDPEVVFLDEPTVGLDPEIRRTVWQVIIKLKEVGKTVFLTTHYIEEAERLCDRVGIIVKGKIVAIDSPRNLVNSLNLKYVVKVKKDPKVLSIIKDEAEIIEENGYFSIKTDNRLIARKIAYELEMNGFEEIELKTPNLEDVFLKMIGAKITEAGELA